MLFQTSTKGYIDNVRPVTRVVARMLQDDPLYGLVLLTQLFSDMIWAWVEIQRKRREMSQLLTTPPPPVAQRGLPALLLADLEALAQERAGFSWQAWSRLILEQGGLGLLGLLTLFSGFAALYELLITESLRAGVGYLLLAGLCFNAGRSWSALVNRDGNLNYMPAVTRNIVARFRARGVPLRSLILGHTHIPHRECLDGDGGATWVVNTGTWISAEARDPYSWETHLVFSRLAAGAAPGAAPEFLVWNAAAGEPQTPLLRWAEKKARR